MAGGSYTQGDNDVVYVYIICIYMMYIIIINPLNPINDANMHKGMWLSSNSPSISSHQLSVALPTVVELETVK